MTPTEREQLLADLHALDALFSGPERWTKYADARDDSGHTCEVFSDEAVRWCLLGAIDKVAFIDELGERARLVRASLGGGIDLISSFNDAPETDFAAVKARIRQIIERVESVS